LGIFAAGDPRSEEFLIRPLENGFAVLGFILRDCGVLYARLIPQDFPAPHPIVLHRAAHNTVYQRPVIKRAKEPAD